MNKFSIISLVGMLLTSYLAFGQQIEESTVLSFKKVDQTINEKIAQYGADEVLVVLDIDNTILTSDTDLGSDVWYRWQRGKLDVKPTANQKLTDACLFNEAIALLYELGTMSLTDTALPELINAWQKSGVTLIALTSRSPMCRPATERELDKNGVDLSISALNSLGGKPMNFSSTFNNRDISYADGVYMTSGLNKGEMLSQITNKAGQDFKSIVFVDDTKENVENVQGKYVLDESIDLALFYYTKIISERLKTNSNQVLTQEQANAMAKDWNELTKKLEAIFPGRLEKSNCR